MLYYYYIEFFDHIISNIENIIMDIIKYYFHSTYFDLKPKQNEKNPLHNTTKPDRVYKSLKLIGNKVN